MENLNNMKKTVLKLEKEISEISMNLSKVQKREHSKMKNIIQNINNLLNKNSKENNIHSNKAEQYISNNKNKETLEKNNNNKTIESLNNYKNNIDFIMISLKQPKSKNKFQLNLNNETFSNKKGKTNQNKKNEIDSNDKFLYRNKTDIKNNQINYLISEQNRKYNDKSRNHNNIVYNQMTYTKPKLNNEFSKSKRISKKQRANSNNPKIINNIFDINNKVDTPMQIDKKNDSISTLKNSSSKREIDEIEIVKENPNKSKKIYRINYKNKNLEKIFNRQLLYDRNIFPLNNLESKENEKNDEIIENNYQNTKQDLTTIKSKDLVFNLKSEENKICNFNQDLKFTPTIKHSKNINTYRNNFINKKINNSRNEKFFIKEENKNCIKSFENINKKIDDEDLYLNTNSNNNNKIANTKMVNFSIDDKYKKENNNEKDNIKMMKLLNMLKVNNINEAISKVGKLLKFQKYIEKNRKIYECEENNNNNFMNNSINKDIYNKNYRWFSDMINKYKESKLYKNFCESIMLNNKIKNFEDFKKFINNILINNKKNFGFLVEVKNILCEGDYYTNNKNTKNINKVNYETNIKRKNIKNKNNNKTFHDLENSNDIKYSRNDDYQELNEDLMKTYY